MDENLKRVLVTDGVHPILLEGLTKLGYACDYHPKISLEQTKGMVPTYEGLIINSKILVDKDFLDKATHLKFIGRLGSGMEIIDQEYAAQRGVQVFSAPEGNCNAVGEHALGMLLALANKLVHADTEVRNMIWEREKNRGFELKGKKIGIFGFGHTGQSFGLKLQGMGMSVLAYDKYKKNYAADFLFINESSPEELIEKCDIISFHLPLTDEVIHLVNDDFINKCKKGVILINTSRGKVIKTEALINGLETGQIGGVCLDVFENEKPDTFSDYEEELYQQLYQFNNVILSPHIAGWTLESKQHLAEVLLEKITGAGF